nr:reverse transcriptase domain-containing protein [Tanacetum cinerariifolium]
MSQDVLTVGSTMRIPLLYRGEYSQWVERFMNYLEEQTDGEAMINSIKNGDQPLPRVTQVSIAGTTSTKQPHLKDKSKWSDQEKRVQRINRLARSLLIQGLPNDIYSLIDSNKTAKDLWDALARHMLGSEYGEQDRKAAVLYEYETFKATEGELLLDTYIRYLQNQGDVNDAMGSKNKTIVVTSYPLALITEKTNVSKSKEKVVVSLDSEGSEADDFSKLKKITTLLAKSFNQRKFYSKPTNNNLRTSSSSQSVNKKQEFVKTDNKRVKKKDDEKKRDMSKVKCYNFESASENFIKNHIDSQKYYDKSDFDHNDSEEKDQLVDKLKIFSGKLKTRWSRPFTIIKVFPYGTVELSQANGPNFKVNGHRVKHYFGGDVPQLDYPDGEVSQIVIHKSSHPQLHFGNPKMEQKITTKSSPATTTTTITPVTDAQLKVLIGQGITDALAARDADRSRKGEDNHDYETRVRR